MTMSPIMTLSCGIRPKVWCADVFFISSCINATLVDEICWPTTQERATLGSYLQELPRCIEFIDGTLVEIPWRDPSH
jgi:hypothetical protein